MPVDKKHPSQNTGAAAGRRRAAPARPWLVFGGAALIALVLYLPTLRYGFVWDDNTLIVNNPLLSRTNPLELLAQGFWNNPGIEQSQSDMAYYRPLSNISLYVDRKLWGLRPTGYHLHNVLINTAIVLLTCLLLWEMSGSVWLAGLGGLLVGIHPAMNCVVTFISNRTYLLTLIFLLVGCYALFRGGRDRNRLWPVLLGVSLLLSALAIEASLVLAAIAAVWLVAERSRYRGFRSWMAAVASPIAAYLLLRLGLARVPFASSVVHWAVSNPLSVINTFGQQLQLLLLPFNQKVIYVKSVQFTGLSAYTALGLLFLVVPLYALVRLRRQPGVGSNPGSGNSARPVLPAGRLGWFGYAWVVLFLLPFAHLLFLGPAGRMLYLAMPGVLILAAALYPSAQYRRTAARVVFGVVLVYAAALAVQTLRRNPIWRNELSLSQAMVLEAPESPGGHLNYGSALKDAGRVDEAIEQFRTAVSIDSDYADPHIDLAFALVDKGDLPGAIHEFREVVRLRPESPKAHNDLALTLRRSGRLDSAIAEYKEALRLAPNSALTLNNLGYAYLAGRDFAQAIATLRAALRIAPDFEAARNSLAEAYRAAGMPDSAALVENSGR